MAKKPSAFKQLATYRSKRDFKKTAEPSGARAAKNAHNSYLIQKHDARRLHYDFRLEMNGVLKSWAVTRGPSLNPADKRLAVHVEDHPLDYGGFEGTIPHGQYGGGTVMLWDKGSWEPIGDAEKSYAKGNLTFDLKGKRLKGRWHLVRMGRRAQDGKHENWLLIKGKDEFADTKNGDSAINKYRTSVKSDRSMEKIATGRKVWQSSKKEKSAPKAKAAPKVITKKIKSRKCKNLSSPPEFILPQLATLVTEPPQGKDWVHEIKFDGYRLQAHLEDGEVRLLTRAKNDWTSKFSKLAGDIAELKAENALCDGEIVHMDSAGHMTFHGLQNALSEGEQDNLHYYIFDLLFLDGEDLRGLPLIERKKILEKLLKTAPKNIHFSEHFDEPGSKVLQHACHIALEGIVSKRASAAYHSGRGEYWLKSKCTKEQEIVIAGFTIQPKHPGSLGALLTGYYKKGELIFSGKVGTGFSQQEGRNILKKLQALKTKNPSFKSVPSLARRGANWVKPELVAQIHFTEWTPDGSMRHPSFLGLREDKPAHEVTREKEKPIKTSHIIVDDKKKGAKASKGRCVIAGITLTHPEKRLYSGDTITKLDLARYYEKAAPLILPQIVGRPVSLMRCPEGEGKPCFFQRHGSDNLSPYIKPVRIKGHGDGQPFLMIEDIRGLISLVQMGVLEIHIWGSEAKEPDKPNRLVFDFDPAPDVPFSAVKKAALEVKKHLKKMKLVSFLKSTGGKGLHVVVPFSKGPTWDEAKAFSRALADVMAQESPDRFTINSRKEVRKGKIFIDYLRNGETASAIAPYSTRARKGAPIAVPLDWSELPKLKDGHSFTLKNIGKRLKKDPWQNISKIKQKLPGL